MSPAVTGATLSKLHVISDDTHGQSYAPATDGHQHAPAVAGATLQIPHIIIFPHEKSEAPVTDGYQHAPGISIPICESWFYRDSGFVSD